MNKRPFWILLFALLTGCALDPRMCKPGERDIYVENRWTFGTDLMVSVGDTSTNLPLSGILAVTQRMDTNKMVPATTISAWKDNVIVRTNIPAEKLDPYFQSRRVVLQVIEENSRLFFK